MRLVKIKELPEPNFVEFLNVIIVVSFIAITEESSKIITFRLVESDDVDDTACTLK